MVMGPYKSSIETIEISHNHPLSPSGPQDTPQQSHSPRRTRRPNQSQQRRLQTQKKRFIKKGMDLLIKMMKQKVQES